MSDAHWCNYCDRMTDHLSSGHVQRAETVHLDVDERYPEVLLVENEGGYYSETIEVDSQTLRRWRDAIAAFNATQNEMLKFYRAAGGKG